MYQVTEKIKYPSNKELYSQVIATFVQPSDAIKFAKNKAKDRNQYDKTTPFCYSISKDNVTFNSYYNFNIL